ncbi:hypothetical protein N657DRAFT_703831 [Parathielavia appendiculata]|uniref:Uncharacterized protein n=1 Tax=Parathielavia appendiculata TaxID=2587402 RepID=A0AAN6U6I0_9PEZI|nr:hypothetical protein N657DRAFT_703831 [Parathielavia appendiculata]
MVCWASVRPLVHRIQIHAQTAGAFYFPLSATLVTTFLSRTIGPAVGPIKKGVLSNRRLVSTRMQIYWECRNMAAQETMAIPLLHKPSDGEDSDEVVMADFMIMGMFKGDAYIGGFLSDSRGVVIMGEDDYRIDYGFPRYLEATTRAQLRGLNEHIHAYQRVAPPHRPSRCVRLGILPPEDASAVMVMGWVDRRALPYTTSIARRWQISSSCPLSSGTRSDVNCSGPRVRICTRRASVQAPSGFNIPHSAIVSG